MAKLRRYAKTGIHLGYPLDQLFHRECRVLVLDRGKPNDQGILFAQGDDDPGSGNIVIMGRPGSGKSTLGLQIAHSCAARPENACYAAYLSLECTPQEVLKKAKLFWPEKGIWRIAACLPPADAGVVTANAAAETLYRLLVCGDMCPINDGAPPDVARCGACSQGLQKAPDGSIAWPEDRTLMPQVLLMSLAPRPTTGRPEDHTAAFWSRYAQLETLLAAACELRKQARRKERTYENPPAAGAEYIANWVLPLVVIDSLNMMAEGMPSRDQLVPLFHLFRKYETTGVFLVESSAPTPFDSTLADVVIELTVDEDQGYSARYFEVVKSRYRNQVNGRHPYKTAPSPVPAPEEPAVIRPPVPGKTDEQDGKQSPSGLIVLPSIHYGVLRGFFPRASRKERDRTPAHVKRQRKMAWGRKGGDPGGYWAVPALNGILPKGLRSGSAVLIEGPGGTYKTNLAMTFLAAGLCKDERVLLIRLHDDPLIGPMEPATDEPKAEGPALSSDLKQFAWGHMQQLKPVVEGRSGSSGQSWQALAHSWKATITVWRKLAGTRPCEPRLYEIDFKTGHLLAEEFMQFIRDIIIRQPPECPITRAVLDDVSEVGVAYPFLRKSSTSGDILLPSFVHLMKDNNVDLVVTGTTGIHELADDAVARVRSVADTVVRTRHVDVFGTKHVVIEGEGQMGAAEMEAPERPAGSNDPARKKDVGSHTIPAVIQNAPAVDGSRRFTVNQESLRGLVGFDQGRLYRPGITLQLFQEAGTLHEEYNRELLAMMRAAFVSPEGMGAGEPVPDGKDDQRRVSDRSLDRSLVTLTPFGSSLSGAVHDGLDIFTKSEPMNGTVICSVDDLRPSDPKSPPPFVRTTVGEDGKPSELFDYYWNVLLLAYRTDLRPNARPISWAALATEVRDTDARQLRAADPRMECSFAWDRTASETLACALLDLLWIDGAVSVKDLLRRCKRRDLEVFGRLFASAGKDYGRATDQPLPDDAAVYLCWYSQLRELIHRSPHLAGKLTVASLPNGGFRGDWRVGIRAGSVSVHLGRTVLNKLLSPREDYKRFLHGVGLPCGPEIRKHSRHYLAWPLSDERLKLRKVLDIHHNARSRTQMQDYGDTRLVLYALARHLIERQGDPDATESVLQLFRHRFGV